MTSESNSSKHVLFIAPESYSSGRFKMVTLRHPKSKEGSLYTVNISQNTSDIREVITLNQDYGAWFIGDTIEEDGRLHLATPVDPLLLVLPYLRSAKKSVPLDHLLMEDEDEFPEVVNSLSPLLLARGLSSVAKSLGSSDLNVWQYDEAKTLTYLSEKVQRVARELASGSAPNDPEIRTAWEILSDYLEPEVSSQLAKHLNLKEEVVKAPQIANPTVVTGSRSLPTGPKEGARPLEDYSEDNGEPKAKAAKLSAPTSKQKALAKSASGSKSITSFFSKK